MFRNLGNVKEMLQEICPVLRISGIRKFYIFSCVFCLTFAVKEDSVKCGFDT